MKRIRFLRSVSLAFLYVFLSMGYCQTTSISKQDSLLIEGRELKKEGAYQRALDLFDIAQKIAKNANDYKTLVQIYKEYGLFYFFTKGDSSMALEFYRKGANLAKTTGDLKSYAILINKIGKCFLRLQQYDKAINKFTEALYIQKQNKFYMDQVYTFDTIAAVYYQIGDYYNSELFARQAIKIAESVCAYDRIAIMTANLGIMYTQRGGNNVTKGLKLLKKSLLIRKEHNMLLKPIVYRNIGSVFLELKKLDSASHYFKNALELATNTEDFYEKAMLDQSMGELYLEKNKADSALVRIKRSYAYFDKIEEPVDISFHEHLAKTYALLKQYDSAYYYSQKHITLKEKQNKAISEKSIKVFENKFKTEKKSNQIFTLKKENAYKSTIIQKEKKYKQLRLYAFVVLLIIVVGGMLIAYFIHNKNSLQQQENIRFKAVIKAEQKECTRIARDLHDSLGQTISLIKLKSSSVIPIEEKQSQYVQLLEIVDNAYDELHDIAYNIMPNVLLKDGLVEAVKEVAKKVENTSGVKTSIQECPEKSNLILNESQRISLYRITQEAISNVIKHAEAEHIIISFVKKGKSIQLSIEDDGKGMDLNKLKNATGMGWKNIYSRVALMAGKVHIHSNHTNGTKVLVTVVIQN